VCAKSQQFGHSTHPDPAAHRLDRRADHLDGIQATPRHDARQHSV
jgi:hypothetical protein